MDRSYTDRDVLNDPRLVPLVAEYLKQYTGNFHVVLRAQNLIQQGETLRVAQVRSILNCMLADTNVPYMPIPEYHQFHADEYMTPREGYVFVSRSSNGRTFTEEIPAPPQAPRRKVMIDLKSRIKFDFGFSMARLSRLVHVVDHKKFKQQWQTGPVTYYTSNQSYRLKVYWGCGTNLAPDRLRSLTMHQANILVERGHLSWCERCVTATEGTWVLDEEKIHISAGNRAETDG